MEKSNIERIKAIKRGFFYRSLNVSKEELGEIIDNIKTQEEVDSLMFFLFNYFDTDLIIKLIKNKNINGNSVFHLLSKEQINCIFKNNKECLKDKEITKHFSSKQIRDYNSEDVINIFLNNDGTLDSERINSLDILALNQLLATINPNYIEEILNILEINKIKHIDSEIFKKINNINILNNSVLKELTYEQFNSLNKEQTIQILIKNKKLQYLNDDILARTDINFNDYNGIIGSTIKAISFGYLYSYKSNKKEILEQVELLRDKASLVLQGDNLLNTDLYVCINKNNINDFSEQQIIQIYENAEFLDKKTIQATKEEKLLKVKNLGKIKEMLTKDQFVALFKNNRLKEINRDILEKMFSEYMNPNLFNSLTNEEIANNINDIHGFLNLVKDDVIEKIKPEHITNNVTAQEIVNSKNFDKLSDQTKNHIINTYPEINIYNIDNLNSIIENDKINMEAKSIVSFTKERMDELSDKSIKNILKMNPRTEKNKIKKEVIMKRVFENTDNIISKKRLKEKITDCINTNNFKDLCTICSKYNKNNVIKILEKVKPKNNFYGKVAEIEILKNLVLLKDDSKKEYHNMINKIKQLCNTKPNSFGSYIFKTEYLNSTVKENILNKDLNEKLMEESIANIKSCINTYYGTLEKNSINNELRDLYSKTLLQYYDVLVDKYNINIEELYNKLENNKITLNREEITCLEVLKEAYNIKPDAVKKVKSYVTPVLSIASKMVAGYYATKIVNNTTNSTILSGAVAGGAVANITINAINIAERNNFFSNKENYYKKDIKKEYGFFDNIKNFFQEKVVVPLKKMKAKKMKKNGQYVKGIFGYNNNDGEISYCVYKNNAIDNQNKKIEIYNKNQKKQINKKIIEDYSKENNKNIKLINSLMEIKKEALKIQYNRKLEEIYKEFPELKKNNVNLYSILKGVLSSGVDVLTLGQSEKIHNCFNDNEKNIKYKKCMDALEKINIEYKKNKASIIEEHAKRLLNLNPEEREKIDNYMENVFIKPIKQKNNGDLATKIYNTYGVVNNYIEVDNIGKKINPNNTILYSINRINNKNVNKACDETITLILTDNIDEEIKLKNINKLVQYITKLKDRGIDITKYQDKVCFLMSSLKYFKDSDLSDKIKEQYVEKIEPYIEKTYKQKINIKRKDISLSC